MNKCSKEGKNNVERFFIKKIFCVKKVRQFFGGKLGKCSEKVRQIFRGKLGKCLEKFRQIFTEDETNV